MKSSVRHSSEPSHGNGSDVVPTSRSAVTVVSPRMGDRGWPFASTDEYPGAEVDPLYGSEYVKDLYLKAEPSYVGRSVRIYVF